MKYPWIDEYLMQKPGVTKDLKIEWNWIRYMIGGKLFTAICLTPQDEPYYITLKLDPIDGQLLRGQFEDILPGYYCNKEHWNSIRADGAVPDGLLRDLLDRAYRLVLAGFSAKKQRELLLTTFCGLDCTHCEYREPNRCRGCAATGGKPFRRENEPCAVAACAMEKGVSHCGECAGFPCPLLVSFSGDPEHGDTPPGARVESCRLIASLLKKRQDASKPSAPFDFKRAFPELYRPKAEPEIVQVPKLRYLAVRGAGDPNEEDGAYRHAVGMLYAVSYALKMSPKRGRRIEGFFDYVVPPLEGFWQQDGDFLDLSRKKDFRWISAIRLPDFISEDDVAWAVEQAASRQDKEAPALPAVEILEIDEGLCVQMLHIGPFDTEQESVARMDAFLAERGYAPDLSAKRLHHELYLSDIHKTAPQRWKTILRQPIKKAR